MKRFIPLAGVALVAAACSEPTALKPSAGPDLRLPVASWAGASFTFSGTAGTTFGYSVSPSNTTTSPSGESFLGQFTNQILTLQVPAGASSIHLAFDLYVIGSWDGYGGRRYGSDTWSVSASCAGSSDVLQSFTTDFSNKITTKQHFPNAVDGALNAGLTGATTTNALQYGGTSVHGKGSAADAEYGLVFDLTSVPCSGPVNFVFKSPTQQLQATNDESWGLDNIVVSGT